MVPNTPRIFYNFEMKRHSIMALKSLLLSFTIYVAPVSFLIYKDSWAFQIQIAMEGALGTC